ncbi:MAG: hypothetical protein ACYC4L_06730 [Chloroflexota bacterium]
MGSGTTGAWLSIGLTVAFTVLGQLLVKNGVRELGSAPVEPSLLLSFVWSAFTNLKVVAGLAAAVAASVFWTLGVSRLELSLAYPFMALGIVLVVVLSGTQLGESIPPTRWLGLLMVCVGLVVATR